jgi:hypothetical protein
VATSDDDPERTVHGLAVTHMSKNVFATAILEAEVVVNHIEHGRVYHFPILSNAVDLEGCAWRRILRPNVKPVGIFRTRFEAAQAVVSRSHA